MSHKVIDKKWEKSWKKFKKHRSIGEFFLNSNEPHIFSILDKMKLKKNAKILDIGCGTGRTLIWFRKHGFKNSIGMDHSKSSISLCEKNGLKKGKDVFQRNIFSPRFRTNSFDLVFSEGLLEHFKDFKPVVKQMCRLSKKYILLIQPNHFGIFKKLEDIYYKIFPNPVTVKEYTYTLKDFEDVFDKYGYKLKEKRDTFLQAFYILLFTKEG
jgi:ubiquinone/menaquinone biosynthesis C-methylase UbiE